MPDMNDGHRQRFSEAIAYPAFLDAVRYMTTDDMEAFKAQEYGRIGVPAKVHSIKKLPGGAGGGYRLDYQIEFAGFTQLLDFDPCK